MLSYDLSSLSSATKNSVVDLLPYRLMDAASSASSEDDEFDYGGDFEGLDEDVIAVEDQDTDVEVIIDDVEEVQPTRRHPEQTAKSSYKVSTLCG